MSGASQSAPILPMPHRVRGAGHVVLRGDGDVALQLDGTGQVIVLRRGVASLHFDGTGARRTLPAGETVLTSAMGLLAVRGTGIEIRIERARVSANVVGRFEVTVSGRGEIESARSARTPWGARGTTFVLDGGAVRELPGGQAA
jgi:hypothetical protein